MKVSFSKTIWKYALLSSNTIISLVSIILISCGVEALGGVGSVEGAYTMAALGSCVMLICFLGCFAALRESHILSIIYIVVSVLCFISEVMVMVGFVVLKDDFIEMASDRIDNLWQVEQQTAGTMDPIQKQYKCCGKESPQDYIQDADDVLPKSCCLNWDCGNAANVFSKGCDIATRTFFENQSDNFMLTLVGLIVLQVVGVVCAYFLSKFLDDRSTPKPVELTVISE